MANSGYWTETSRSLTSQCPTPTAPFLCLDKKYHEMEIAWNVWHSHGGTLEKCLGEQKACMAENNTILVKHWGFFVLFHFLLQHYLAYLVSNSVSEFIFQLNLTRWTPVYGCHHCPSSASDSRVNKWRCTSYSRQSTMLWFHFSPLIPLGLMLWSWKQWIKSHHSLLFSPKKEVWKTMVVHNAQGIFHRQRISV